MCILYNVYPPKNINLSFFNNNEPPLLRDRKVYFGKSGHGFVTIGGY